MSAGQHEHAETGGLPGRYQWTEEPTPMGIPTDPNWSLFSDTMRNFAASPGATNDRNDGLGTVDAVGHSRGTEEPDGEISYDLQRFPVDGNGDPVDPLAYAADRDAYNRMYATLLITGRVTDAGGNFGTETRTYTVMRGVSFAEANLEHDASEAAPILATLDPEPSKVRSYIIHQPDAATAITVESDHPDDVGMDVTVESEGGATAETVSLTEETDADGNFVAANASTTATFDDVDAFWTGSNPVGDLTVVADDGTVVVEGTSEETAHDGIAGGLTYSDDNQPVDGDRGVPPLGAGSNADPIEPDNPTFEHFKGDRVERTPGTPYRPRVNSLETTIENSIEANDLHRTRAPANDPGNRNVQIEADIAGPRASHDSMMDALQATAFPLYHEYSGGVIEYPAMRLIESDGRDYQADDQSAMAVSETLEATDGGGVVFHAGATIEDVA